MSITNVKIAVGNHIVETALEGGIHRLRDILTAADIRVGIGEKVFVNSVETSLDADIDVEGLPTTFTAIRVLRNKQAGRTSRCR